MTKAKNIRAKKNAVGEPAAPTATDTPSEWAFPAIRGVQADGEFLRAASASLLRQGGKHAWLEIMLDEGRNRQIRRLLAATGIGVLRLVRVAIGPLALGSLPKGQWRELTPEEVAALGGG